MSILKLRDKHGVMRDVYALKGEKGEPGGSIDLEALKKIEAIQQELIENGSVEIEGNLPAVGNDGDVLTVVDGEWKSEPPSGGGGGQAEFATVTDYEGGGKNLTTEGSLGLNANNVVVNGASFSKDGNFTKIAGISVPEDADPYFAVNKKYVDEVVANAGDGGGQAEFATVTDVPAGGKRLETDGNVFWGADEINLNGACITKEGGYAAIDGVYVPYDEDSPYRAVNIDYVKQHVSGEISKAIANLPDTDDKIIEHLNGYQPKFASITAEDWGVGLQAEKRLHLNADAIMVNNAEFDVDNTTGYSVLSGIVVPENPSPFTAVNKMYVDDAVANVGSGSGGGGGVDYIIEEGSAQIKDAAGIPLSSKPAKYRKWNNGFVEVDASFDYAPSSCIEMATVYSLGSISFNIHDTSGSKKLFAGGVIQAYCSFSAIGSWCSCFAVGGEGVDVVLNFYSAIPENTTPFTANVYIRGYWK